MTTNSELSTSRPLPRSLVERISQHMLYAYGKRFTDLWGATNPDAWLEHWGAQLAGYTVDEIKRGLAALGERDWPPTLPEFKRMCRPPLDPQAAFYEAVEGVQARERGEVGTWSHPAIYWAAVKVGAFDLKNQPYAQIGKRWETALEAIFRAGGYPPIPEPAFALPAPGKTVLTRESEARLMAELGASGLLQNMTRAHGSRAWVARVRARQQAGDATLPAAAIRLADQVEGAGRPDRAGEDDRGNDDMTNLGE